MIANNNEDERSKIWNIVMAVSTIVIIAIALFFVVKIFHSNPLEGTWVHDGDGLTITVNTAGKAAIEWPEKFSDEDIKVNMDYSIEKDAKVLQLKINSGEVKTASETSDGKLTEADIEKALRSLESTFDYSVDGSELTLTDREYGDQMFFEKK